MGEAKRGRGETMGWGGRLLLGGRTGALTGEGGADRERVDLALGAEPQSRAFADGLNVEVRRREE